MIQKEIIDLINSGEAVAFIGSGISVDANLPTWGNLYKIISDQLTHDGHDTSIAQRYFSKNNLLEAFEKLSLLTSRKDIHERTRSIIAKVKKPGIYHNILSDWPFKLFITPNYDCLLEGTGKTPLLTVGNEGAEIRKLYGGVSGVVWHIHGAVNQNDDMSKLIVTKSDYENLYPESNVASKIKSITSLYRCIYIGFGFNDPDISYILQTTGRLSHSGRPSYAFFGYDNYSKKEREHSQRILNKFNIEILPYYTKNNNHNDLFNLLNAYNSFVVSNSISLGRQTQETPDYNPTATSLKIQSCLDIDEIASASKNDIRTTLIGARILASIREHPEDEQNLKQIYQSGNPTEREVSSCIEKLREQGIITPNPNLKLTPSYYVKTEESQAILDVAREKFLISIRQRLFSEEKALTETSCSTVSNIICKFANDLCKERGLGVAQNLATSKEGEQSSRRTVALIQKLPDYLGTCQTRHEALSVIDLTTKILTNPVQAESYYLGLLCQAYFGQHLAGASDLLANIDISLISDTCYVLDASVLISLLAENCENYESTSSLINNLLECGATLTTTDLFVEEIMEHARWPLLHIRQYGEDSDEVLAALRCLRDYRPNLFLRGYYDPKTTSPDYLTYISKALKNDRDDNINIDKIINRLKECKIETMKFDDWQGFDSKYYYDRQNLQETIRTRRTIQGTYKHDRQIQAEAEVALIVSNLRHNNLSPKDSTIKDAFFLSNTRVVDGLPGIDRRISIFPDGLSQWLFSSQGISSEHAELVYKQLTWDLARNGIEFVNTKTLLRKFSGVVEAAESDLKSYINDRRDFLVEKYGSDPATAFTDIPPLDIPRFNSEVKKEILEQMEKIMIATKQSAQKVLDEAKLNEKERQELEKYRKQKRRKSKKQ